MNQRLKYIFTVAAVTAASIILFQMYWVYQTYRYEKRSFENSVSAALQSSLDQYQLQRASLPHSLSSKTPYLSVINAISETNAKVLSTADQRAIRNKRHFDIHYQPLKVTAENMATVRLIMAKLTADLVNKPIDLNVIAVLFKKELKKDNITLPFQLKILDNYRQMPAGTIGADANFGATKTIVAASLLQTRQYLFRQSLFPALISLILILFSGGSLWYMGVSIIKQLRLDKIKDEFIDNMTHELRTPISVLKTTNEALYHFAGISDPKKAIRYLDFNTLTLNKLEDNVERILDISRYEQGVKPVNKISANLNKLVADIKERFGNEHGHLISFSTTLLTNEVRTDQYMIETILVNLIDNAIKYTVENPVISITASPFKRGWQLQVTDNGIGISEEFLPLIFDKFYRVSSGNLHEVKGYGLGLSYVRQLVSSLSGHIVVTSKLGEGSIFTIQFPEL